MDDLGVPLFLETSIWKDFLHKKQMVENLGCMFFHGACWNFCEIFSWHIGFCNEKKTVHSTPLFGNQISNLPGRSFVKLRGLKCQILGFMYMYMHYIFLELT